MPDGSGLESAQGSEAGAEQPVGQEEAKNAVVWGKVDEKMSKALKEFGLSVKIDKVKGR